MKSLMLKAAKAAGKVVLKNYGRPGKIRFKNPRSIVTQTDILSEKIIIGAIKKRFPNHNFLSEECGTINKNSKYTWIIDPIDGTTNFVSKIPEFAVSIALAKNDKIVMGAVYNPVSNKMFFAEKGKGSYLNNKQLHVSRKNKLKDCLITFSLPSSIRIAGKTLFILTKNYGIFRGLRNFGSAALNLCYIAEGKFDLYFSLSLKSWDVAAAKLIVEESEGKTTNLDGKKWNTQDISLVATNGILHNKFIELLNKKTLYRSLLNNNKNNAYSK